MTSIGGYFELELRKGDEYHPLAIRLNTGRNAFEYVLEAKQYRKVYLPYYTCKSMLEPIVKLKLDYSFYTIDKNFFPKLDFDSIQNNEVVVYTNYFGICDKHVSTIAAKCINLIVDNAQAFFSRPLPGVDTFYSPRKFFGLPDGAYLYTDIILNRILEKDVSYKRCEHLLGRLDNGAEAHFQAYKDNSKNLISQPIKKMSNLTQCLLSNIDYQFVSDKRKHNFNLLHNELRSKNNLNLDFFHSGVPMIYPFLTDNGAKVKEQLIKHKVFVATYWPGVLEWSRENSFEAFLVENLIAIPVDQRYSSENLYGITKQIT